MMNIYFICLFLSSFVTCITEMLRNEKGKIYSLYSFNVMTFDSFDERGEEEKMSSLSITDRQHKFIEILSILLANTNLS